MSKPNVFISYSHLDEQWKDRFSKHLGIAEKQGLLQTWDDRQLRGGDDWFNEIVNAIEGGSVVVLLVSHNSLTSNFILNEEVPRMLAQRGLQKSRFYPVIIEPCDWKAVEWLKPFNLRPRDGRPVGINKDRVRTEEQINFDLAEIAEEIRMLLPLESVQQSNQECPYRGLEVFEEKHHKLFFGRDNFIEAIWQKLQARQFVAVVGPSGCGKSSVIQAGVFPRLGREWRKLVFQPGDDPFLNLADKFVEARGKSYRHFSERCKAIEAVAQQIRDNRSIAATVAETLAALSSDSHLLVVADQFEELFTLTPVADRQPFVEALLAAAHLAELKVFVTLRADFFGQAISLTPELSQLIQDGVVTHRPLQRADWEAVILQPAKTVGLHVDPALVALILEEIEAQPDSLPLLEYALKELWQQRTQGRIGLAQYEAIGRLAGAINQRADAVLAQLSEEEQKLALRALTRLVRVSGGEEEGVDTRLRLPLNELTAEQRAVLQSFINERLLVTNRHDRTGEETIEVAHEALIRRWGKLREALDSDREFLVWRKRLDFRRREWEVNHQHESLLLRGLPLGEAKRWMEEKGQWLTPAEISFITWEARPEYQIERILLTAQELFPLAKAKVQKGWLSVLICVGEKDRALKFVEESADFSLRDAAFGLIAKLLTKLGNTTEALDLVETKTLRPMTKDLSLSSIAMKLAQTGEVSAALKVSDQVKDAKVRTQLLRNIAGVLARAGFKEQALKIAFKTEKSGEQFSALSLVAKALARGGFVAEALTVTRDIQEVSEHDAVLKAIAIAQARMEEADKAIETIGEIVDLKIREDSFRVVAGALARNGIEKGALTAVQRIKDWNSRQSAIDLVEKELMAASGVSRSLQSSEVMEALQEAATIYDYARKLLKFANVFLNQGYIDKAQKLIAEIPARIGKMDDEVERSSVVKNWTVILTRLRDYHTARERADKFCLSSDRLAAYTVILREYHLERDPSLARLFADEAAEAEEED
jgi:hypothetical protein